MSCAIPTPGLVSSALVVNGTRGLARPPITSFLIRNGSQLLLDGAPHRLAGANVYWLGVDENVSPSPSIPSQQRVLDVFATAASMGANAVRSTTLGVSVGCTVCVEPSLGSFNPAALAAIDFAIAAATAYGIRLVVPLVDSYAYYHGGAGTFQQWRGLSSDVSPDSPFFDTSSQVHADFVAYVRALLDRNSSVTGRHLSQEPALAIIETGNELTGYGQGGPPPLSWTRAVAQLTKSILPNALVLDGSYGINDAALSVAEIDLVGDHYYPMRSSKLRGDASRAQNAGRAFIAGEFDWTNRFQKLWYLLVLVPVLFALVTLLLPRRWFPWRVRLPRRRRRSTRPPLAQLRELTPATPDVDAKDDAFASSDTVVQPLASTSPPASHFVITIRKWHLAIAWLLLAPVIAGIVYATGPSTLPAFLSAIEGSSTSGSFYWSLFGRTDDCCAFVNHNDGFTLHYNSTMQDAVVQLTQHAYRMSGQPLAFASSVDAMSSATLPIVACPQPRLL